MSSPFEQVSHIGNPLLVTQGEAYRIVTEAEVSRRENRGLDLPLRDQRSPAQDAQSATSSTITLDTGTPRKTDSVARQIFPVFLALVFATVGTLYALARLNLSLPVQISVVGALTFTIGYVAQSVISKQITNSGLERLDLSLDQDE